MNKLLVYLQLGVLTLLFFSGCNQPQLSPANTNVVFIYGKPYAIPKDSLSGHPTVNKYQLLGLRMNGIKRCDIGDAIWVKTTFINKYIRGYSDMKQHVIFKDNPYQDKALKLWNAKKDDEKVMAAYHQYKYAYAIRQNKAGCVKPLNNKEYRYMLFHK